MVKDDTSFQWYNGYPQFTADSLPLIGCYLWDVHLFSQKLYQLTASNHEVSAPQSASLTNVLLRWLNSYISLSYRRQCLTQILNNAHLSSQTLTYKLL